jgi:hypothetical protein
MGFLILLSNELSIFGVLTFKTSIIWGCFSTKNQLVLIQVSNKTFIQLW